MEMLQLFTVISISLLIINHRLCAGHANKWLHHPALKGRGESSGGHEEDPFCFLIEVFLIVDLKMHVSNKTTTVLLLNKMAVVTLPSSFLRQDVAFFDANKTGQLVNRLTADIQEFKSSFKLVISQVLSQLFTGPSAASTCQCR